MAESGEMSLLDRCLEVALNPIGSLALADRLDASRTSLMQTFNVVSPRIVDLILSPYGFRIVESFLNANTYVVNVGLAEHLGSEWSGLERVLRTERGRYVCDALLQRKLKPLAQKILAAAPTDWWFKNTESLPILVKAINMSNIDVAKQFISNGKMELDLCDSSEGLYCVLKVKGKSMDQPGWRDALSRLVVLKARSDKGSDALEQAMLYGDYLVNEMVEILCCRRESYDDSTTAALLVRLIERGSADLKRAIVKCLCEPADSPTICAIRRAAHFEEFKNACDANFTPSQRKRLDDHLASAAAAPVVRSIVDESLMEMMASNDADSVSAPDGQNKKRRRESPVPSTSAAKKPREEGDEPQPSSSKATVPEPSTVSHSPTVAAPSTVPPPTIALEPSAKSALPTLPTVSTASTILWSPTVATQFAIFSPSSIPLPVNTPPPSFLRSTLFRAPMVTAPSVVDSPSTIPLPLNTPPPTAFFKPTVSRLSAIPLPPTVPTKPVSAQATVSSEAATVPLPPTVPTPLTVTIQPAVASPATVPNPSTVPPHSTVGTQPISSSTVASPATVSSSTPSATPSDKHRSPPRMSMDDRLALMRRMDPGRDVTCMAMGEKYRVLLSKLTKDPQLSRTIYICIHNALLCLMMDERGSEVVKWFIANGSPKQRSEIERKVEENIEELVTNGGYGRTVAQFAIDNCANSEKKADLSEKFAIAMTASRDSLSPALADGSNEIEIVSQKVNQRPDERSTVAQVANVPNTNDERRRRQILREETLERIVRIVPGRTVSNVILSKIREQFELIDDRMIRGGPTAPERKEFIDCGKVRGGWSQFFIDQIQARLHSSVRWMRWMSSLTQHVGLRPFLVAPMVSVLHLLEWPSPALALMLSRSTREAFAIGCMEGDGDSALVRLFQPDFATAHCVNIGMQIAKAQPDSVRAFLLSPLGRSIAETEKGREFFESLAKPQPEGCGWTDLLEEKSPPAMKTETEETSETSTREEQAIAQPTVISPRLDTVSSSSQSNTVASAHQNTEGTRDDLSRSIHQYIKTVQSAAAAAPSMFAPPLFAARPVTFRFGSNGDTTNTADSGRQGQVAAATKPAVVPPREDTVASRQLDTVANRQLDTVAATSKTTTIRSPSIFSVQPSKIQFRAPQFGNEKQAINNAQPTVSSTRLSSVAIPATNTTPQTPSIFSVDPSKIRIWSYRESGSEKQAINNPQPTVSSSLLSSVATPAATVAPRCPIPTAPSVQTSGFQFGSKPFLSSPFFSFGPPHSELPLFQSPLINVSSSGVPSFPILHRPLPVRPPLKFSFAGPKPAFVTVDQAVKDTVEAMVSTVANEKPWIR